MIGAELQKPPKYEYDDAESLLRNLEQKVIDPARTRADQLQGRAEKFALN